MKNHEILDDGVNKYLTAQKKAVSGDLLNKMYQELSVISENDIFIMNDDYFTEKDKVQLSILGWKDLSKYIELPITFMSANFENSLIYKAKPDLFEKIELNDIQERTVSLNERLKVYYFSEEVNLSKTWKNNNADKLQHIYDYLNTELADQEFYWTNNNNDKLKLHYGTKISPDARGLNDYKKLNTCVWLACMRPDSTEAKLCELLLKITGKDIHIAREYENLHQFVLRGISRQFDSDEPQIVYVFDKSQAQSLSTNIEHIPGVLGNIAVAATGRPKGAKNITKLPTLSDTKAKRFNRWKLNNQELELDAFKAFLASATNADLSANDITAMWGRYEKEVQKTLDK